ncbi:hypothetical protein IWZ00DRAFT_562087 [Phyllosticta capitalensis]|uniref:uncharacterized protein n=1 Tax=Phyllosticta capitalensis TaxID=121624 RepID=UPI003130BFEA
MLIFAGSSRATAPPTSESVPAMVENTTYTRRLFVGAANSSKMQSMVHSRRVGCAALMRNLQSILTLPQEAQTGVVELLNDPPAAIRLLLQFLYTGKYNYFVNDNDEPSAPLCLFHLDVYICGVIYQLSELQKLAKASFLTALCERKTMANCVMPTAIATLYKSTPESDRGLRDYFEDYSVRHMPMLLQNPSFLELMLTCNSFRRAVARATHYQRTRVARLENHIADLQVQIKIPEFEAKQTSQKYRCPTKGCRVMMRSRRLMATDDVFCVGCKTISDTSEWKEDKSKKGRAKLKN